MRLPFDGNFRITQTFGNKLILNGKDVYAQWGLEGHNGIDFGLPFNTPTVYPHDGTIKEISFDKVGYGWYVKLENTKEGSVLAHNNKLLGKIGDKVKEGQDAG